MHLQAGWFGDPAPRFAEIQGPASEGPALAAKLCAQLKGG
jgi:hypothetical protein